VERVDVLRNDFDPFAELAFQVDERDVPGVRRRRDRLRVKRPENPVKFARIFVEKVDRKDRFRRRLVNSGLRAEIGDSAFCTDACSAEKDDIVAITDDFSQLFDLFVHHTRPFV
jgi:hypothetical protein